MSQSKATRPAINYKLKDNPFFAAEQKDAKPPLAKINKSPVTQTTSKLPKPFSSSSTTDTSSARKHARASVQRMAASSTVSANPWKAKMVKPSTISKKHTLEGNSDQVATSSEAAIGKQPSMSAATTTTATATTKTTMSTTTLKSAIRRTPSSSSSTSSSSSITNATVAKPSQQREDLAKLKQKFVTAGPSSQASSSSAINNQDKNTSIKERKEEKIISTEKVIPVTESSSTFSSAKEKKLNDDTATSKELTNSIMKSLSVNDNTATSTAPTFIHSLDKPDPVKSLNELPTASKTMMVDPVEEIRPRSNSIRSSTCSSSDENSIFDGSKNTLHGIPDKSSLFATTTSSSTTTFNSSSTSIENLTSPPLPTPPKDIVTTTLKGGDEKDIKELGIGMKVSSSTDTMKSVEKEIKNNNNHSDDDEPIGNKVTLTNALEALQLTSQQSQLSVSSLHSFSGSNSSSSSDYGDDDDGDDDVQEITTETTFNTSSNIVGASKSETMAKATSNSNASTPMTAFGITVPWSQYAHADSLPAADESNNTMMMADSAEIGRQLAVSHAAITAMEFPTLNGIMDAEKWQKRYSRAKSNVGSIRDRVLLETSIQRTYSSMLKLAVDQRDRHLVMDIQARTTNIDELTQELYYTFSHVCESQERYLHHLAGTLAVTYQSDDRLWNTTTSIRTGSQSTTMIASNHNTKKRREDYPDVVLRLEKLAKKCSFSLPSKSTQHHQDLFKRNKTKSNATTVSTRFHADSVSDDGSFSDDSMFHTSVRTSMTSFDDHQQVHALLDIIEKQLISDGKHHTTTVAGDKCTDENILEKELIRLREREIEMQHRFDNQTAEFSKQRQEWEYKLLQAKQQNNASSTSSMFMRQQQQKSEQQLTRETEAREISDKQLKDASQRANLLQQELQKQLDQYRDEAYNAKQREYRLQDELATANRRIQELELELVMASTAPTPSPPQQENRSLASDKKISELNQSLLQADRREKELVQKLQELEKEIVYNNEKSSSAARSYQQQNSDYQVLLQEKQIIQKELETSKQRENSTRERLDTLHAQVNQALTKTSASSLDAMVTQLLQRPVSSASAKETLTGDGDIQQELDQLHAAFKSAQEEYTRREAALMLQSASVEAELGAIFKEYDKLTRNITDFNHERKKYEQQVQALTREKHLLDKQLADYKVKDGIGKDGSTMTLRKEFRQLMAKVKTEHEQEIEKESEKRHQVEIELRNMKHELEMKRWDTVNTGIQTKFVAYPPIIH